MESRKVSPDQNYASGDLRCSVRASAIEAGEPLPWQHAQRLPYSLTTAVVAILRRAFRDESGVRHGSAQGLPSMGVRTHLDHGPPNPGRAAARPPPSSSPRHESTRAIASARQCIRTQRCPERHHLPQTLTFDTAQSPCSRRQRPFPFTCSSARHPVNAHSEGHPTRIASKLRAPRCAPAKPHLNALQRGFPSVFRYLASPSPSDGGPRIPPESSHLMRKPLSPLPWTEQWRSPPKNLTLLLDCRLELVSPCWLAKGFIDSGNSLPIRGMPIA